jgi:hypothetical protein
MPRRLSMADILSFPTKKEDTPSSIEVLADQLTLVGDAIRELPTALRLGLLEILHDPEVHLPERLEASLERLLQSARDVEYATCALDFVIHGPDYRRRVLERLATMETAPDGLLKKLRAFPELP